MRLKNYLGISICFCLQVIACISCTDFDKQPKQSVEVKSYSLEWSETKPIQVDLNKPYTFPVEFDTSLWTEVTMLDDRLSLDLRYATTNNFVEEKMYDCPRCFLRPEAALALKEVHSELISKGYHIKLLDCYRPKSVQEKLWAKVPNASYVTPPKKGSMHNRGYAIDVTLLDKAGNELDMGSPFDFFGREAHLSLIHI